VTPHDRSEQGEPVVVRDRRRIDPDTGEVRSPSDVPADGGAGPAEPTTDPRAVDPLVEKLTAEVAERTADLQRVTAEYANYRRRIDRDRESVLVGARVSFVSELLTVLDDLDRAELHGDLTGAFKAVGDKITSVVQKLGLEPFGLEGEPFDPSVHEAVQHDMSDAGGTAVAVLSAVLRRGYRIGDRVLRPAMVTVVDRVEPDGPDAAPTDPVA
jgi:molecular chaperone GrpE